MSILVVIRGNSGSGKSTVASAVQRLFPRGRCLLVPQDIVRRHMLREYDTPSGGNVELIERIAGFGLERGLVVVVEGILSVGHYGGMLERLSGRAEFAFHYSFDLTFEETLVRHAGRKQAGEFGAVEMAGWYHGWQPLGFVDEVRIDVGWGVGDVVERIHRDVLGVSPWPS
ncbi:hypothetical protein ABZ319_20530 [Nocardia sp. NPDC005978]|uniref:hypothetical protein n=1 Tax=Nocardia sp. NPDC005978 TaxID=3156725 RepID=UPI0033B638EE